MSPLCKRLLISLAAIVLPLTAAPYLMQRFGTPTFIDAAIQANHNRQKAAAGGIWCAQFNSDGSPREILYGADKCGEQKSQTSVLKP